jgi:16S rRNA (guanine527-N7)-methyltransferase
MISLHDGIEALGLRLGAEPEARLEHFLALLAKWNRTYNLTAITEPQRMVTHHALDALAVLPHLESLHSLADIGSGAGIPGIPLAIARPDLQVASVEANQKKTTFQQQAKIELRLDNLAVHCCRAEAFAGRCDAAISRAFSSLADFVAQAGHIADRLLAMKGAWPDDEIAALPAGWRVADGIRLVVPGLDAERHLIVLGRN